MALRHSYLWTQRQSQVIKVVGSFQAQLPTPSEYKVPRPWIQVSQVLIWPCSEGQMSWNHGFIVLAKDKHSLDIDVLWVPKPIASRAIQEPGTVRNLGELGWPREAFQCHLSSSAYLSDDSLPAESDLT